MADADMRRRWTGLDGNNLSAAWPLRYRCSVCGHELVITRAQCAAAAERFAGESSFRLPHLPAAVAEKSEWR
ncbi:MAG TPA: hypothetical protein PKM88_13765 [bacterium]|nr:hypothetical protein [bacterium]